MCPVFNLPMIRISCFAAQRKLWLRASGPSRYRSEPNLQELWGKKRVAPSDSLKNFGLGGMSPKFFYRYCKACKKRSFDRSGSKKLKNRCFLPLEDPILQAIQWRYKNFGNIPPRPKFFEESDGATRFSIGSQVLVVKCDLLEDD